MEEATLKLPPLEHLGSLITYQGEQGPTCLGYLVDFGDRGVWDAHWGPVPVTPQQAEIHNEALEKALLEGLDRCEVGQWGSLLYVQHRPLRVLTWLGREVSRQVKHTKSGLTFKRRGRTFRGKCTGRDSDLFDFERIA